MIDDSSDLPKNFARMKALLNQDYPQVHRMAIAIYHPERDTLQTYLVAEDSDSQLYNYETKMSKCLSLQRLAAEKTERIINDLSALDGSGQFHTHVIRQAGYQSSFTIPLMIDGQLHGFLFANSREVDTFDSHLVARLKLTSKIMALMMHKNYEKLRVLKASVESLRVAGSYQDPDNAERLQRTAQYTLIMARYLADQYDFSDVYIDFIYLYASLHDIGQIKVPEHILLKKGRLSDEERSVMERHARAGYKLVERLVEIYGLDELPYISILNAMTHSHHEKMDGSGYPEGLKGDEIPIEARMVAVADILDALLNERPHKRAWTIEEAYRELRSMSGIQLDADCVDAILHSRNQIQAIRDQYADQVIMMHEGSFMSVTSALLERNKSLKPKD